LCYDVYRACVRIVNDHLAEDCPERADVVARIELNPDYFFNRVRRKRLCSRQGEG
jgi:hypothetical protein